jgi:hypothetical protein
MNPLDCWDRGFESAGGMNVRRLRSLYVDDHSFRGVIPDMCECMSVYMSVCVCVCEIERERERERRQERGGLGPSWAVAPQRK